MQRILFLILVTSLLSCSKKIHVADTKVSGYEMDDQTAPPDERVVAMIFPYKKELEKEMNEVIGEVAERMEKKKPESTLGNWVADVIHEKASSKSGTAVDFAIQNYGGIRIGSVSQGPITRGKVYELMPFDNLISILELPGNVVDSLVTRFAISGGWPVSKGLNFRIKDGKPLDILIGGMPLDLNKTYRVAMPDYIANGGDRMGFLRGLPRDDMDYLIRDALIDFIRSEQRSGRSIHGVADGRVQIVE